MEAVRTTRKKSRPLRGDANHYVHPQSHMAKLSLPFVVILAVAIFVTPVFALAHGSGKTLEKAVGDFVVDVEYEAPELRAGEPVRFSFNIWNKDRTRSLEFSDVWVKIVPQKRNAIFAGDVHNPELGSAGFTHTFPKDGPYELTVRFQKNGEQLTDETSFPLTVLANETEKSSRNWDDALIGMFVGMVIAVTITFAFVKNRRKL